MQNQKPESQKGRRFRRGGGMNILVTSGGTIENIDSVRSITNHSTGRLGSIIADCFARHGASVTYLCGENAALPKSESIKIIHIRNVLSLMTKMDELMQNESFDSVIHAAAVSDYTPEMSLNLDDVVSRICAVAAKPGDDLKSQIMTAISETPPLSSDDKISSDNPKLLLVLKQTPKIISRIKSNQPNTILVGFKLLSNSSEEALLRAANKLIEQNACDFVLANDLRDISGNEHRAILLSETGIVGKASTKQEIAKIIFRVVRERVSQ